MLQAVSGGTVVIQEDGNNDTIDYLNRHRKIALVRSTSCEEDIARNDGLPMKSIIRLFKPDAAFSSEKESTYCSTCGLYIFFQKNIMCDII